MPSRLTESATREKSPPSESEKSFVSAESENTSSRGSHQSAAPADVALSPKHTKTTSDPSDSIHKNNIISPSPSRRSTTLLSPSVGSYFSPQPGSSGIDPRTPQARRAPASRSSHGIETASGPPPALSTQRSYTGSSWRKPAPIDPRAIHPPLNLPQEENGIIDSTVQLPTKSTNEDLGSAQTQTARAVYPRPSTSDGVMTDMGAQKYGSLESDEDRDTTVRINGYTLQGGASSRNADAQEQSQSSHEDLFLNLARDDSVLDEPPSRSERRRSRIGASSFSQPRPSRPSSTSRPSTSGGSFGAHQTFSSPYHSQRSSFDPPFHRSPEKSTLASHRDTSSRNRPYAASAHPLDQRHRNGNARTSFDTAQRKNSNEERPPETPRPYGRRRSIREPSPGVVARNYKQSNLSYTSNGDYGSSPVQSSPAYGQELGRETSQAAGTESTVSTTAPSTVWDELDDLKSRLRKLELTGILPKSSNAAMSNVLNERPPTATTTMTTISSSPKRRQVGSISPEASTIRNLGITNLHPLLHSALAKAKPVLKADLYQALEATASDALNLAAMTGCADSQGASPSAASVVGAASTIDRQLRRKADNMCRSLTELCIVLAEETSGSENSRPRPESRDTASTEVALPNPKLVRGTSDESEMKTSSRVMSRLEARRASLLTSSPLNGRRGGSPQEATTPTQTTPVSSRSDRTSVFSRNRPNEEEVDTSHNRRPLSRANTEIGQTRSSPQTRTSREYTSQHPMPNHSQRSPSMQSSLPARRGYFNSSTSSPLTPSVQPGSKRYLDRSTPPSSADSARLAEARQRRIASLGQASSRIGGVSSGRLRLSESEQGH